MHKTVNTITDALEPISNIQKVMQLGFNWGWAVYQQAQNAMLYGTAAFQGVRDFVPSLIAIPLAFDKEIAEQLPKWWQADFTADVATVSKLPKDLKLAENLSNAGGWIQEKLDGAFGGLKPGEKVGKAGELAATGTRKYISAVFNTATFGDNAYRRALGIYNLHRGIKELPASQRALMEEGFSLGVFKRNVMKAAKNPKLAEQAGKEVELWLGKYDKLTNSQRRALRAVFPYYNWWAHSVGVVAAMPLKRPYKTMLLNRLFQQAPFALQDPEHLTEFNLRRGAVMTGKDGPNNYPEVVFGSSLSLPFFTPLELESQAKKLLLGYAEEGEDTGNPLVNAAISQSSELFTGVNFRTGRPFVPSDAIRSKGKIYNPDTSKEITFYKPNNFHIIMRGLISSQEAQLREFLAYPALPADDTSLTDILSNDIKVKRQFQGQYNESTGVVERPPLQNYDIKALMLYNLLKLKPHEQTFSADMERQIKRYRDRSVRQARMRQGNPTDEPSSFMRIFGQSGAR